MNTIKDIFSVVRKPPKAPVEKIEYIKRIRIRGKILNPNPFLNTFQEIDKYCR